MSLTSRLGFGLALSLMAGLSAPMVLSAPAIAQQKFSDVSSDHPYAAYINRLSAEGIVKGLPDGTFHPNDPMTRSQFAALLRQASFISGDRTSSQSFADVPANDWAADAIGAARSSGFLSGYPGNTFKPNDRIVRVQALISLANGLKYPSGNSQALASYQDADTVPNYARPSTAAAAQANLIVNYPALDQIAPGRSASRGEVAAFVYQALVKAGRAEPLTVKAESSQSKLIATLSGNPAGFSKDGKEILTLPSIRGDLQIWNSQTGALIREIEVSGGALFNTVAISHDGTKVAAISLEESTGTNQLNLWAVSTGERLWQKPLSDPLLPSGYSRVFKKLVFSADDRQIIMLGELNGFRGDSLPTQLNFQDVTDGNLLQSLDLGIKDNEGIDQIAFSPDGQFLASSASFRSGGANTPTTLPKPRVDVWQLNQSGRFDRFMTIPLTDSLAYKTGLSFLNSGFLSLQIRPPYDDFLDIWNLQTREQIGHILSPKDCAIVQPSQNGKDYMGHDRAGKTCLGNLQTGDSQKMDSYKSSDTLFSDNGDYFATFTDYINYVPKHGPDPQTSDPNADFEPLRIFSKFSLSNP